MKFLVYNSSCSSSQLQGHCCFLPLFPGSWKSIFPHPCDTGLQHLLSCRVLLLLVLSGMLCSMGLRVGHGDVPWAFCRIFPSSPPLCSQPRADSGIFLFICTLKVRADFALCFYHVLQMPLRCFFLCYLKILRSIDFWVFSKGLKISAVTLKPTEIIDYLFLPPLQLFTSCPSMEKGCPISRWFTVKQIFAEF